MNGDTTDVMIDLETLGTVPGSVVLSIGAACSDSNTESFYDKIDIRDSLYAGLTADPATLKWWSQQSREAWLESTKVVPVPGEQDGQDTLRSRLGRFTAWLEVLRKGPDHSATGRKLRLWGDAASFDLVLLACAYRAANMPVPWKYTEEHCYRTLRQILKSDKPASKLQHDALGDARAQLLHLQELLKMLESKK